MVNAACRTAAPAKFFPSDGLGVIEAVAVCKNCQVRSACLQFALENVIMQGVWGAKSERQRVKILKQRRHQVECGSGA